MENETQELVKKWEVRKTPFLIVQDNDTDLYFGIIGNYRITELFSDKDKLEKELKTITWDKIVQLVSILMDLKNKEIKINN